MDDVAGDRLGDSCASGDVNVDPPASIKGITSTPTLSMCTVCSELVR